MTSGCTQQSLCALGQAKALAGRDDETLRGWDLTMCKWSKGPDVLNGGRSSFATVMDGPPSLPGMFGSFQFF